MISFVPALARKDRTFPFDAQLLLSRLDRLARRYRSRVAAVPFALLYAELHRSETTNCGWFSLLERQGLVRVRRRGLGLPNAYELLDLADILPDRLPSRRRAPDPWISEGLIEDEKGERGGREVDRPCPFIIERASTVEYAQRRLGWLR